MNALFDIEAAEWQQSLDALLASAGQSHAQDVLANLGEHAQGSGLQFGAGGLTTPYINSIPAHSEQAFPGDAAMEERIANILRWNAMAMVVRANRRADGVGGHLSTYTSAATLYETGFNHFFRGRSAQHEGDKIYIQGHASPGIYARAFLEGRLTETQLDNFRRELAPGGGLSSYPHPWLMPDFWEYPTVSMGLGPLMAIYQARFQRYLENRGMKPVSDAKVWAFLGDGEMDEPESMGALTLAARENLDNLNFVINCNLQRLDGPVRGNGKIIQELEGAFRGAGWNVIKVLWGSNWDPVLANDHTGTLVRHMGEVIDGQYQRYKAENGKYVRDHFFGAHPETAQLVANMSDSDIWNLKRGGHDIAKVYNAYKAACEHSAGPTVILAKTVKGFGLGDSGEGKNTAHQQKKLSDTGMRAYRDRFDIPVNDAAIEDTQFYKPAAGSPELEYLQERRAALGGYVPARAQVQVALDLPKDELYDEFFVDSGERKVATTMAFVRLLSKLLRDPSLSKHIVPIVPDEARTFGMEGLFREIGIYSSKGQQYDPVDGDSIMYYHEAKDGQLLEEGITEAGGMSSLIAAGTAYANAGVPMIPFFIYYSMFGFQRIGDLVWAASDMRCRGFLLGATAGRTTLAGEGLQHQDGHSLLLAYPSPTVEAYDPAFAYEVAVIVREGMRRMYQNNEDTIYYITLENEPYHMPAMPEGSEEGILRGIYRAKPASNGAAQVQLCGSGSIMGECLKAQSLLAEHFDIAADVWSVTSYKALHCDALDAERWNLLNPTEDARVPYVTQAMSNAGGVCIFASDYMKVLPESIARWVPLPSHSLGTDGFGRSETRESLRDFFEVDAEHIAFAAIAKLVREGMLEASVALKAQEILEIDPEKANPVHC